MNSPWGKIDNTEATGVRGVTWVSTPSHGGYRVTEKRTRDMSPHLYDLAIHYGGYYWFEEDCDWVAVILTWPEIDADRQSTPMSVVRANALKSLRRWQPDTYKAFIR